MLSRIGSAAIALGLIAVCQGSLAQERIEPALESQPVPEAREQPGAEPGDTAASQQEIEADHIVPPLKAIEGAIRDLITEQDPQQRNRQNQREIADLQAQQDMAFWAKAMFWATVSGVAVTFVGVCLVFGTPIYTKMAADAAEEAVIETRKGAVATADAAQAALDVNKMNREFFIGQTARVDVI